MNLSKWVTKKYGKKKETQQLDFKKARIANQETSTEEYILELLREIGRYLKVSLPKTNIFTTKV